MMFVVEIPDAVYEDETPDRLHCAVFVFRNEQDVEQFITGLLEDEGMGGLEDRSQFRVTNVGEPALAKQEQAFYELFAIGLMDPRDYTTMKEG